MPPETRRRRHSSSPVSTSADVLNILECCICLETCSIPIIQCTNGHNVCAVHVADHFDTMDCCPTCRPSYSLGMGRNRLAEKLIEENSKKRKLNPDLPTRDPDSILETIKKHNAAQMLRLRRGPTSTPTTNHQQNDNNTAIWHDDEDAWERATLVGGPDYWGDDGRDDDWYGAGDDDDWGDDGDDNIEEDDVFGDADAASVASTNYQDEDDEYFHDAENEGDAPADFEGEGSDDDQEAWGGEDWSRSVGGDEDDQVWDDADNWVAGYTHWENDWGDE
ncbi:protein PFC0760c [Folsomia candida]|uniref:protein PFC0760c n=1 Tax=Folsomia candida TaxID=158441 RepID=UPI000B906A39|nr:protein PFC0760c [Folsomia candida]